MAANGLIAQPLGSSGGFNWVFLIELLLCAILSIFFLFYFNRVVATVISFALRAYTWHKYKVTIDITSLQLSLLGGRLFFKSIKYQGHNETILIHDGRITWRYWLRTVQEADVFRNADVTKKRDSRSDTESSNENATSVDQESAQIPAQPTLPCRFHIRVSGVEAFLYNHSPSYDHLVSEFQAAQNRKNGQRGSTSPNSEDVLDADSTTFEKQDTITTAGTVTDDSPRQICSGKTSSDDHKQLPAYLSIFPIQVECKKAAAAVGNENTPSVIVAKTQFASGRIDASKAGPLDIFKLIFDFNAENVNISMRQNQDFKELQLAAAAKKGTEEVKEHHRRRLRLPGMRSIIALIKGLHRHMPWAASDTASVRASSVHEEKNGNYIEDPLLTFEPWHGLARFLTGDDGIVGEWDSVEYARMSSLGDFDRIGFKFYWDIPGVVDTDGEDSVDSPPLPNDPNGSAPPGYGMDITLGNGIVNYGPWTDRERVVLQSVFFPASMVDSRPLEKLQIGAARVATVFKMTYLVDGTVTVRLPTREASKDWKHQSAPFNANPQSTQTGLKQRGQTAHNKGKQNNKTRQDTVPKDKRPFAWMDVSVSKDTVVHYDMDMYARHDGYHNSLSVQVKEPQISTSVNHDILWRSGDILVSGDLSNPLAWNALRTWKFNITCHDLELFILRDHMFLLTDLITDWTSGPTGSFHTFVPFKYELAADFHNFNLILNANDLNIINRPSAFEDNNFLMLKGRKLHLDFHIPLEAYRPPASTFDFDVLTEDMSAELHNPHRNTLDKLLNPKSLGKLPKLTLKGNMFTNAEQSPLLTDVLQMDICGTNLDLLVHGYLLRYFINVKENYFGRYIHFQTVEEHQASNGDTSAAVREQIKKYKYRKSNDLDVILSITVERPTLKIPSNLFLADNYLKLELPVANVDLRVTNYYLDLQLDVSPVSFSYVCNNNDGLPSSEQLRIEAVALAGHRLFGLPPVEPAYVSTWDVVVGCISGRCSPDFLNQAVKAGIALGFGFEDSENAIHPDINPIDDMVFAAVRTDTASISMEVADAVVSLGFAPLRLNFDDSADNACSSRLTTRVPDFTIACRVPESGSGHHSQNTASRDVRQLFYLETTIDLALITRKRHFQAERLAQQQHLARQDVRTERAAFLKDDIADNLSVNSDDLPIEPPAMAAPGLPSPITSRQTSSQTLYQSDLAPPPYQSRGSCNIPSQSPYRAHLISPYMSIAPSGPYQANDLSDVPNFSSQDLALSRIPSQTGSTSGEISSNRNDEQVTLIVHFTPGIRALMRPEFLEVTSQITSTFTQATDHDILDTLVMSVFKIVQNAAAVRKGHTNFFDLRIILPSLHLRTVIETGNLKSSTFAKHHLELTLYDLTPSLRISNIFENDSLQTALILHTSLDILSLELFTNVHLRKLTVPDIHFELEEVLVWASLAEVHIVDVSFKVLSMSVSAYEIQDTTSALIKIIERVITMVTVVSSVEQTYYMRMRRLLEFISHCPEGIPDPLYVSRMTYGLRLFPDHLRNQDSWRMLARIRNIHSIMPQDKREKLKELLSLPKDAVDPQSKADILGWCSWDIPAPQDTVMYRYVYGETDAVADESEQTPLQLSLNSGLIRFRFGPSTRGSEVSVTDLSINVEWTPPSEPTGLRVVEENIRKLVCATSHSSAILLRLKWDLVDAIIPVLDALEESGIDISRKAAPKPSRHKYNAFEFPEIHRNLHFVFSTDAGTVMIDTINAQHIDSVRDLKASVIATSQVTSDKYASAMCLLIAADHATTELHSRGINGRRIGHSRLTGPKIYLDARQKAQVNVNEINIGGTFDDLKIEIEQEPIHILDMVDKILVDEAIQVLAVSDRIKELSGSGADVAQEPLSPLESDGSIQINAALLAGHFRMDVSILQSLILNMQGDIANLRVKPLGNDYTNLGIDIEVGPIQYAALDRKAQLVGEDTLFHTPSARTAMEVDLTPTAKQLKVSSTIEEMLLEASTVQNLISLFRRAELQVLWQALGNGISNITDRVQGLRRPTVEEKPRVTDKQSPLQYHVDLALAGLRITATAPVQEQNFHSAELSFGLGAIECTINSTEDGQSLIPEIFAHFENIYALLDLANGSKRAPCGHVKMALVVRTKRNTRPKQASIGDILVMSDSLDVEVYARTASSIVDIITHIHTKLVALDLSMEMDYLKKFRPSQRKAVQEELEAQLQGGDSTIDSLTSMAPSNFVVSMNHIRFAWITAQPAKPGLDWKPEDLEFTLAQVEFAVRHSNRAQLKIDSLCLQMTPKGWESTTRSSNSALLPELLFIVRFKKGDDGVHLAFQAVGEMFDIKLHSDFAGPLGLLISSGSAALQKYRDASAHWKTQSTAKSATTRSNPFGTTKLACLLVNFRFAGIMIHLRGRPVAVTSEGNRFKLMDVPGGKGKDVAQAEFKAPGIGIKLQYAPDEQNSVESALTGEVKINASSNTLHPELVPIILQVSDHVKIAMRQSEATEKQQTQAVDEQPQGRRNTVIALPDESILTSNDLLAKTKISIGLRVQSQQFGLSCQPFAKVNARAKFDEIYMSVNTCDPPAEKRFIAMTASLTGLTASVQHMYSRESTFSFEMQSVTLSTSSSKATDKTVNGVSAIVQVAPMRTMVNARQMQDLLLFREIWFPEQMRPAPAEAPEPVPLQTNDAYLVERYRQVAAAAAFPWNATISLSEIDLDIDFGQSIGKSSLMIKDAWAMSTKTSDWKQELCTGIGEIQAKSVGRMGGSIDVSNLRLRTLIEWPLEHGEVKRTPLIQATVGFDVVKVKAAFDYQPFAFAELSNLSFIMFNVRDEDEVSADRLVANMDFGTVYAYFVATSPAQAFGLYQAFERLIQEKRAAFQLSVTDLQKQLRRPSLISQSTTQSMQPFLNVTPSHNKDSGSIKLRTDVLVGMRSVHIGVFPGTFFDGQILKMETSDLEARFAVDLHNSKLHSSLGLVMGQLQVALASAKRNQVPRSLGDIPIEEVILNGAAAKGGTILRVPRLTATMQTWQPPEGRMIDYIFKSAFEGKVDVGWNYSRISSIRTMWASHAQSLAARLGKAPAPSAVRIALDRKESTEADKLEEQEKITAVVNMPLSRYEYQALEPPIIETPQLRDLGEATPSLEWIGLQRDKLPHVVHQVVVVSLQELAKEVEDAYGRILGRS